MIQINFLDNQFKEDEPIKPEIAGSIRAGQTVRFDFGENKVTHEVLNEHGDKMWSNL